MINVQELIFNQIERELRNDKTEIILSNDLKFLPNGRHIKEVKRSILDSNGNLLFDLHSVVTILIEDNDLEKITFDSKADNFSPIFMGFFINDLLKESESSEYFQLLEFFESSIQIY